MISLKTESIDDLYDELDFRCPKCKWYFSSITKPYILPCNHNICLKCIEDLIKKNTTICPVCKSSFNKEEKNRMQLNLVFLNVILIEKVKLYNYISIFLKLKKKHYFII